MFATLTAMLCAGAATYAVLDEQLIQLITREASSEEIENAVEIWTTLADKGDADALYALGVLYFHGIGVPRDGGISSKLIEDAAYKGQPAAQLLLARDFEEGRVRPLSLEKAVHWYETSANNGHWIAASRLERAYRLGELGLEIDEAAAERLADLKGNRCAKADPAEKAED